MDRYDIFMTDNSRWSKSKIEKIQDGVNLRRINLR